MPDEDGDFTFADFVHRMGEELEKNPGILYTKMKVQVVVDSSYSNVKDIFIDTDRDLIISDGSH